MIRSALVLAGIVAFASPAVAAPVGTQLLRSGEASPNATVVSGCNTPKLSYGNGPLIQHVKVFDVFYNKGNTLRDMLTGYFTAITQSAYFDWLTEYNTTNYKITRGSYLGLYEDANSATTAKTLTDTQVQTYLSGLIDGAKVPAPDDDTIYMIFFPSPVAISLQGSNSCASGGFCAYHSSYTHGGKKVRYSVMPDQTTGGCAMGCGPGTGFQNTTDVASHELIEAVTDPDGGSGWYDTVDQNCGEIGDICAVGAGETAMVAGYAVQKEWSNKNNNCIATDPNVVVNDFTVAATPATVNVPVGGMATTMIKLTKTAGTAENAALTATAPTGLTASFAPASVTSDNGSSTLTISAAATATVGAMQKITVKAAGMSVSPTVDVNVVVVDAPDMAQPATGGSGGTGGGGSGGSGGGTG
ncbi:MAG: hemagglutinin protein, partial [bacterium]|nr:hemagglutinin protein [bacterium]